jgi:hypothetical protein
MFIISCNFLAKQPMDVIMMNVKPGRAWYGRRRIKMGKVNRMTLQPDVAQARILAEAAVALLIGNPNERQCDSALWRLVDAAGLLARGTSAIGASQAEPTGRGFYVGRS